MGPHTVWKKKAVFRWTVFQEKKDREQAKRQATCEKRKGIITLPSNYLWVHNERLKVSQVWSTGRTGYIAPSGTIDNIIANIIHKDI